MTTNGKRNEIFNGIPDWVYEGKPDGTSVGLRFPGINLVIGIKPFSPSSILEEVFASDGAIWWSTTGKYFAYAEFNDTEVQKVEFSWYGSGQYPETRAIPYPKVRLEDSACVLNIHIQGKIVVSGHTFTCGDASLS